MAKKRRKKKAKHKASNGAPGKLSIEALEAEVSRCETAGDFKAMLAVAKNLHKRRPDAATSRRLADAYTGRIGQLAAKGLFQEAAALLPFRDRCRDGHPTIEDRRVTLHVLLRSGQWEAAEGAIRSWNDPEAHPFAADLLLLHPDSAPRIDPDGRLAADLSAVQRALAAYDRGEDEAALEALRPLGLKSPFRYWKMLIRGLVAFHQGDEKTAAKSFQAIPEGLAVADLAAEYLELALSEDDAPWAGSPRPTAGRAGSPTAYVSALQAAMDRADPVGGLRKLQAIIAAFPAEPRLHRIAAAFYWHRLVTSQCRVEPRFWPSIESVIGPFVFDGDQLARTVAIALEQLGDRSRAVAAWANFASAVAAGTVALPGGLPKNRVLAQIYLCIARNMSTSHLQATRNPFSFGKPRRAEALEVIDGHLEEAQALDPASPEPYLAGVAIARDDWGDVDHAFRWAERLVKAFPEHLEGLLTAADLGLKRGVYRKALGFVQKAEALEPLHNGVRKRRSRCLLASARKRVSRGKHKLARKDYHAALPFEEGDQAAKVRIELGSLELATGNLEEGRRWIHEGVRALGGGVGSLLRVVVESKLKGAGRGPGQEYLATLTEGLSRPEPGQAVELVGVLQEYEDEDYPWKEKDRELVLSHVKRCAKMDFSREDAFTLCQFLADLEEYQPLGTLAGRSASAHPEDFHFPVFQVLAKAKTRPGDLRSEDEDVVEACQRRALEAGEEGFARFADDVLWTVESWICDEEEEDEDWDEAWGPFGPPPDLLEQLRDILQGAMGKPGKNPKPPKKQAKAQPAPAPEPRAPASQLNLFGDDE